MIYVWINAFIPKDISGITKPVPGDSKTMIDGPPGFKCFLTDQRRWSRKPDASARIHAGVKVRSNLSHRTRRRVGPTHQVDCEKGSITQTATAPTNEIKLRVERPVEHMFFCRVRAEVANPIIPVVSPDIDLRADITIHFPSATVSIAWLAEPFPAFEAYAKWGNRTETLFRLSPKRGASPWDLFGDANRAFNGEARFT